MEVPASPKGSFRLTQSSSPGEQGFKGGQLFKQFQETCVQIWLFFSLQKMSLKKRNNRKQHLPHPNPQTGSLGNLQWTGKKQRSKANHNTWGLTIHISAEWNKYIPARHQSESHVLDTARRSYQLGDFMPLFRLIFPREWETINQNNKLQLLDFFFNPNSALLGQPQNICFSKISSFPNSWYYFWHPDMCTSANSPQATVLLNSFMFYNCSVLSEDFATSGRRHHFVG